MLKPITSLTAAIFLFAGGALAQAPTTVPDKANRATLRTACQADIAQHCAGIETGGGRRHACLVEKKAQLSAGCRDALDQRGAARLQPIQAPAEPPPGAARPAPPAAAPPAAPEQAAPGPGINGKGQRGGRLQACRTDVATHCQGVEKGKGWRIACLTQNLDKLDPACRTAVVERKAQVKGNR